MWLEPALRGAAGWTTGALCLHPPPPKDTDLPHQGQQALPGQTQPLMSEGITQHSNTLVLKEVFAQHQGTLLNPKHSPSVSCTQMAAGWWRVSPNPPDRHLRTSCAPAPALGRPKPHTRISHSLSARDTLMNFPSSWTHWGRSSRNRPSVSRPWTPEPILPAEVC